MTMDSSLERFDRRQRLLGPILPQTARDLKQQTMATNHRGLQDIMQSYRHFRWIYLAVRWCRAGVSHQKRVNPLTPCGYASECPDVENANDSLILKGIRNFIR